MYLTHCYAINGSAFELVTDMVLRSRSDEAIDSVFVHNASFYKVLCCMPPIAFQPQRLNDSDIEKV